MSQIKTGTVAVTNGQYQVHSETVGTDWSGVDSNNLFIVEGNSAVYYVSGPAEKVGNFWYIFLTAPYGGATGSVNYAICRDFSPNLGLPLMETNDRNLPQLFTRAMLLLDAILSGQISISNVGNISFVPGAYTLSDMVALTPARFLPIESLRQYVDANGKLTTVQLRDANGDATDLDAGICRVSDYGAGGGNLRAWYSVG